MKTFTLMIVVSLLLNGCIEEGKLKILNKVHNSKIENISFGKLSIYGSLLPGQTSDEVSVTAFRSKFPFTKQLEFYMESNGNKVYLKTKKSYDLDYDETLLITITDSTEVINPLLQ